MKDTSPEIRKFVHDRYMAMTGEERFLIGAEMFDTARCIVQASFPPGISELERRKLLCERFYGKELAAKVFHSYHKTPRV
ncbi:MAG: hypothetical protein ACR2RB_10105 [Gammaproteobacteria bacterium]